MENQIFTVKEVAKFLNCSTSSIRTLVRTKSIPMFKIGAKLNFSKSAIESWIAYQEKNNMQHITESNQLRPMNG